MIPLTTSGEIGKAPQIPLSPIESLSEKPTTAQVKLAVVYLAENMGLNKISFYNTINCESQFSYQPKGWNDGGLAYGVAQFHKGTFNKYCKGNYHSAKDQLVCMGSMWKMGLQSQWTCYIS